MNRKCTQMVYRLLLIATVFLFLSPGLKAQSGTGWNGGISSEFAGGYGDEGDPFLISTPEQLAYLAQQVNKGTSGGGSDYEGKYFKLTADIDLNNQEWTPIGTIDNPFKGNFNGDNHAISNLYISTTEACAGLFGAIDTQSAIKIQKLSISIGQDGITRNSVGEGYSGGIVGRVSGSSNLTIRKCFVTGSIIDSYARDGGASGGGFIGGLVGGTVNIEYCYVNVQTIKAKTDYAADNAAAGGFIGIRNQGSFTLENCVSLCGYLLASATVSNYPYTGNMAGTGSNATFTNCFSSPFTMQTLEKIATIETTFPTGTTSDKNGEPLTSANFNPGTDNAFDGWGAVGWIVHPDRLPTLNIGEPSPELAPFQWDGAGTEYSPFKVKNEYHLSLINGSSYYLTKCYIIANSFNLTTDWTPIKDFAGKVDGDGYVISGLKIPQRANAEAAGLFANLKSGAKISNLGVMIKDEVIAEGGSAESGGIAGKCEAGASIENCFVADGKITGLSAGSIAGTNEGTIYGCYATTKVAGIANASIGGISGSNTGTIQNSYAIGKIAERDASNKAGGISGTNTGTIENCLALNKEGISGTTGQGRITGENTGTLIGNQAYPCIPGTWTNEGADQTDGALWEGDSYPFPATRAITVWDMTTDPTLLPRLQVFIDKGTQQPADNLKKAAYQTFKVTLTQPAANGTITATYTGNSLVDGENSHIPSNTVLTLAATPAAGYQLKTFTADDAPIGNTHTVIANVTLSATFESTSTPPVTPDPDPVPDPSPTVYYTVTLPVVEGATTDPVAGEYEVEAWGSFRFYLTLDKEYDQSEPVITTDRGETITPRSSDGAYIVKYVRNDVEIFIDGIVKNPDPVGNEVVATDAVKVWAAKGNLHISTVTGQTARVYNLAGSLVKQAEIPAGDTLWPLPSGIYIVQIADTRYKVIL